MRISTIAFANLRRRKGKALFLAVGIAIGIGTVVALYSLSSSIQEEIGAQLDKYGANILIVPQSNSLALDYGGISVPGVTFDVHQLQNQDIERIREIPYRNRLSVIAPKVLSAADVEGKQVLVAGVDFKNELLLKRWWQLTGGRPQAEKDILVGYEVARALSIIEPVSGGAPQQNPGHHADSQERFNLVRHEVQIAGQKHQVAGVIGQTGGPEDRMVFGSLAHIQALVDKPGQLDLIEVSALCKGCPVEDIVAQIRDKLPHAKISAVQQAVRAREEMVQRLARFSAVVSVVVLVIGALMIFTTMTGSVVERTKEIGVFRAIGFRRTHIIKGLIMEVAVISLAGGLVGWALGLLASWVALPYFTDGAALGVHPAILPLAVGAALLIGTGSSIYPAIRASQLDPSEAVRYI